MEYNKEQILELYENEKNKTYIAQEYCRLNNLEYSDNVRRRISKLIASSDVVDNDLENDVKSDSINYSNDKEKTSKGFTAINDAGQLMPIEEYCQYYGLDVNKIRSYKLISHTGQPFYNCVFYTAEEEAVTNINEHLEEIITKYIKPTKTEITKLEYVSDEWFDRLVFTDVHIAMDVNGNGDPLYDGKWDREELFRRLDLMIQHALTYQKSNTLLISNLGDYMDGLGGETTRKGHELPQNMNDKEAFDLGIEFSLRLVDSLVGNYEEIRYNFLVEDNHSGVFSYFVSQAIKGILEQRYPNKVKVKTQKKFIDHIKIGKHTLVESHGKDSVSLKFGFRPHLDDKQAKKIDHYLKENGLYDGNFIEFSKGDSHLGLFDESTSTDFHYYNYPAFSPPSGWIKANFSNTKAGFRFFNIKKDENIKNHFPYWF